MNLQTVRRLLGRGKQELLHGASNRRLASDAKRIRETWSKKAIDELPSLPKPHSTFIEVNTMCGNSQFDMGIWASWSLMRFLPEARLIVHSDGTLSEDRICMWKKMLPGTQVRTRETSLAQLSEILSRFRHVNNWTESYHFGLKLGAFHGLGEGRVVVDLDTDVLFFREPTELIEAAHSSGAFLRWNQDIRKSYAYSERILRDVLADELRNFPERLNGGLLVSSRLDNDDWEFLESALSKLEADARTDPMRYWMHQTLFALLASRRQAGCEPLSKNYDIYKGATKDESIARHYVGEKSVRPRFFTEGIFKVVEDAKARGQLPKDFGV